MAINSKLKCLMLTALFFSALSAVQAQTANYFLDPDSETPRFIQRLTWTGGTYSLHCEVIIEKEEGGGYVNFMNTTTTTYYLELSLPPGNYRFRVIPYDILGKPAEGTQWKEFTVYNAVKPEIYQPEEELDYFVDNQGSNFEFNGKNFEPDVKVYFVNSKGEHIVPAEVLRNYDGSSIRVVFDKNQLVDGEYEVIIVNPGGLETSLGGIDYKSYREKFGLMHYVVGVSFMPSFQVFGEGFSQDGFLFYINARASIISCMFDNSYIGMEFTVSNFYKFSNDNEWDGFTAGFNFLFINWLPGRSAAVNFRLGAGFDMQPMDLSYTLLGLSFMYRIYENFYIEAGAIFPHSMINTSSGEVQPWIGLTVLF
jgi:hypothetical protein